MTPSPPLSEIYVLNICKTGGFFDPPPIPRNPTLSMDVLCVCPPAPLYRRHGIAKLPDLPNRITRCRLGSFMTGLLRSLAFSLTVRDKQRLYYKSFLSVCRPWTVGWSMNAAFKSFGNWRQHSPDRDMTNGAKRGMEWMDPWP